MPSTTESTRQRVLSSSGDYGDLFLNFHNNNPHVYETLVALARSWKQRTGRSKTGINYLIEILRWESDVDVTGSGRFRYNAAYSSYYAQLLMQRNADLRGLFTVRGSGAAEFIAANYSQLV